MGSACFRRGNRRNLEYIEAYLAEHEFTADIDLVGSRCEEMCRKGPNLMLNGRMYHEVSLEMLTDLLDELIGKASGE